MKLQQITLVVVYKLVAPLAGAWIEISMTRFALPLPPSPPSRGRGLKFFLRPQPSTQWSRPPRGGVD